MAKNKRSGEATVGKWDLSAGDEGFDAEKAQKREKIKHIVMILHFKKFSKTH